MRYLARLARETTATVRPRRGPSWLDAVPFAAHCAEETAAESSAAWTGEGFGAARDAGNAREGTAAESDGANSGGAKAGGVESRTGNAAMSRNADHRRSNSDESSAARRAGPELSAPDAILATAAKLPRASREMQGSVDRPLRDGAGRDARTADDAAPREAAGIRNVPLRELALREVHPGAATLQSVLSELARRQQLLDERQRTSPAAARQLPHVSSNPRITTPRDADEARLDIGSIVVQVMPDPSPSAAPRTAKPQVAGAPDRRWARSFLDRST